jgi:hypothetical protein
MFGAVVILRPRWTGLGGGAGGGLGHLGGGGSDRDMFLKCDEEVESTGSID